MKKLGGQNFTGQKVPLSPSLSVKFFLILGDASWFVRYASFMPEHDARNICVKGEKKTGGTICQVSFGLMPSISLSL